MYNHSRDGYRRPPQTDVLAVLDGYEEYIAAPKGEKPADVDLRARLLYSLVKAHGPAIRILAVVHQDDKVRQAAYKRLGCTVRSMTGDRPVELLNLINDEVDQMIENPPRKLIIRGGDAAYGPLCKVAHSHDAEVLVWPLNGHALAPQLKPYAQQSLDDLLPDLCAESAVVTVKLDAENHLYSLHKAGLWVDTKTYLAAVRKAVTDLGEVVSIQATADWKRLRETLGHDCQWEFEDNGVRTDYRRNIPGKNTSDLALAGSIHESLERDPKIDTYVLGTGDSDFTPVVEAIHSRGKQVYVIELRASMSRKLEELADGVRYLDDYLATRPALTATLPTTSGGTRADVRPVEELTTLLQVVEFLGQRNWPFAYRQKQATRFGRATFCLEGRRSTLTLKPPNSDPTQLDDDYSATDLDGCQFGKRAQQRFVHDPGGQALIDPENDNSGM